MRRTGAACRTNRQCSVVPTFIVEVKVAESWQQVGSAPTREAAATLAAVAVRRISFEGKEHTQVRIYLALPGEDRA